MPHEEHDLPYFDCPTPSPCCHLMGMCPLLSSSLPTEGWKLPKSHLSECLAHASTGVDGHWRHWDVLRTAGSWEGAWSVPASFWHSEAAQWQLAGINVFLLSSLLACPSLPTTSNGESWRLHLPPAAVRALQPRDRGGVLLWPWLHPYQRLQVHHLPVWRVVPLLPSVLCQNR